MIITRKSTLSGFNLCFDEACHPRFVSEGYILTVLSGIVSSIIVSIIEVKASTFSSISSAAYTSDQSSRITFLLRAFRFSVVKSLSRLGKAGSFSFRFGTRSRHS